MMMKFKSRRDVAFSIIMSGTLFVLVAISTLGLISSKYESIPIWIHLLDGVGVVFLLWIFFGTYYELANGLLTYKSGPIKGSIKINDIREIVIGKTLWAGLKPATATKGLIIKFGKFYDEVYISPQSNDLFIKELLKVKIVQE